MLYVWNRIESKVWLYPWFNKVRRFRGHLKLETWGQWAVTRDTLWKASEFWQQSNCKKKTAFRKVRVWVKTHWRSKTLNPENPQIQSQLYSVPQHCIPSIVAVTEADQSWMSAPPKSMRYALSITNPCTGLVSRVFARFSYTCMGCCTTFLLCTPKIPPYPKLPTSFWFGIHPACKVWSSVSLCIDQMLYRLLKLASSYIKIASWFPCLWWCLLCGLTQVMRFVLVHCSCFQPAKQSRICQYQLVGKPDLLIQGLRSSHGKAEWINANESFCFLKLIMNVCSKQSNLPGKPTIDRKWAMMFVPRGRWWRSRYCLLNPKTSVMSSRQSTALW